MKKSVIFFALILICSNVFCQVRDYVGIVRQHNFPKYIEYMEDLSESYKSRGLSSYSKYIDSYLKGSFGSGFIYVDSDGTNYIITNNHVVNQAESASIEFENSETGAITKYDNLSILVTDDDIDIAILKFEDNKNPFVRGLTLSDAKVTDGIEVISAGFPGLGGEPVWQLGKGSVTNSAARIKDLVNKSVPSIIQHSAQVDGGNSGGPLMIPSKQGTAGYEVIGINTWKAVGRESTNFALPVSLVKNMIGKAKSPVSENIAKAMRLDALKELLEDTSSDYTAVVKFISYECASDLGADYFENIMNYGSSEVRNRVLNEFTYNPLDGFRYAVAYNFFKEYSGENATDEKLSELDWVKEHGTYRLMLKNTSKSKKRNSSSGSKKSSSSQSIPEFSFEGIDDVTNIVISGGINIPFEDDGKNIKQVPGFNLNLEVYPWSFPVFGFGLGIETKNINDVNCLFFSGDVIVRVPLNFNVFCIGPKIVGGIDMTMSHDGIVGAFAELDLEATFNLGLGSFRPGISAGYRFSSYTISNDRDRECKNGNVVINLCAGFVY